MTVIELAERCADGSPPEGHDYESAITMLAGAVSDAVRLLRDAKPYTVGYDTDLPKRIEAFLQP